LIGGVVGVGGRGEDDVVIHIILKEFCVRVTVSGPSRASSISSWESSFSVLEGLEWWL
jgi:hypothetical protein